MATFVRDIDGSYTNLDHIYQFTIINKSELCKYKLTQECRYNLGQFGNYLILIIGILGTKIWSEFDSHEEAELFLDEYFNEEFEVEGNYLSN